MTPSRLAKRALVHAAAMIGCLGAWFVVWVYLLPDGFGMPEYEDELELAAQVGAVVVLVASLFVGSWMTRLLERDPGRGPAGSDSEGG